MSNCGSVDSNAATVSVCHPPSIGSGPVESGHRTPNTNAYVQVYASGSGLTYQWYIGQSGDVSQPIYGATSDRYDFIVQQTRYYWVRITGECGTVNSAAVLHSVAPAITQQPASTAVPYNGRAVLQIAASGSNLTYQWYRGSSGNQLDPMVGEVQATFTTPPITATTYFWCKVTSGGVSAYSSHAAISICNGPSVQGTLSSQYGNNLWYVSVKVNSVHLSLVRYEWYRGVPGDIVNSVRHSSTASGFYVTTTSQETWWCRVWFKDNSCYKDSNGTITYPY